MNNVFLRSLMIIFALLYILTAIFTIIVAFNFQVLTDTYYFLDRLDRNSFFIGAVIVSVILLLSAFIFLILGMKRGKDKKYVSRSTNNGEVRISFVTIKNLVTNVAGSFNVLKNIDVSILNDSENISIAIKSHVLPGVSIPDLIDQVQEKVKISVEESMGISVNDVKVYIEDIYQENHAKNSIASRYLNKWSNTKRR